MRFLPTDEFTADIGAAQPIDFHVMAKPIGSLCNLDCR